LRNCNLHAWVSWWPSRRWPGWPSPPPYARPLEGRFLKVTSTISSCGAASFPIGSSKESARLHTHASWSSRYRLPTGSGFQATPWPAYHVAVRATANPPQVVTSGDETIGRSQARRTQRDRPSPRGQPAATRHDRRGPKRLRRAGGQASPFSVHHAGIVEAVLSTQRSIRARAGRDPA
jgi:hypothetical protein